MTQESEKHLVTPKERLVGFILSAILVLIATGIFIVQYRFNPAVTARQTLSGTQGKTKDSSLTDLAPKNVRILSPLEFFDPASLSDKINGKAELYFSAGFKSLKAQRFALADDPSLWFEIFVYDMGTARNAFSVFSMQRRGDFTPFGNTLFAYGTPNGRFLAHGRFYLEIIGAKTAGSLMAAAEAMAQKFIETTDSNAASLEEMALFPEDGRIADSRSLVASDAFGISGFNQVFTAQYIKNGTTITAYAAFRESDKKARAAAKAVNDFYLEYGGKTLAGPVGIYIIDILDTIEVVFQQDQFVIGVHEAPDLQSGLALARQIQNRLKKVQKKNHDTP